VSIPSDPEAANWIRARLGEFGSVGGLVPSGFETYLLVDHHAGHNHQSSSAGPDLVAELAALTAGHTSTPSQAWFAIWVGYGWTTSRTLIATTATRKERRRLRQVDEARAAGLEAKLQASQRFDLPNRGYYLLAGPVAAASTIERPDSRGIQPPDLWWPDDKAWFIGTDTDLSWTYVGGSQALAEEVATTFSGHVKPVDWSAMNASAGGQSDLP